MAKNKIRVKSPENIALLVECASLIVAQSGICVNRPPHIVAMKVSPVAIRFVERYGPEAPKYIRLLGPLVANILVGIKPIDAFFEYPQQLLELFVKEFSGEGVAEEIAKQLLPEGPKADDPPIQKIDGKVDVEAVKASSESIEQRTKGTPDVEYAVSNLGLPESIITLLFQNEIGTTVQLMEFDANIGLQTIMDESQRKQVLIAYATKTGSEVVI